MTDQNPDQRKMPQDESLLGAAARMVIGGLSLCIDLLSTVIEPAPKTTKPEEPKEQVQLETRENENIFYSKLPESTSDYSQRFVSQRERRPGTDITYIFTGILVDSSNRLGKITKSLDRTSARASRTIAPLVTPFTHNILTRPLWKRFDRLVARGEAQVSRWEALGEGEATQGKALIQKVTLSTVDSSIDYVTNQKEVVDLATTKTRSLLTVLMEYIRSIFISMDLLIHGIIHRILRRPGFISWTIPPSEIREGATIKVFQEQDVKVSLEDTHIGYYAGLVSRIAAFIVDLFIVGIAFNITGWFVNVSADLLGIDLNQIIILNLDISSILAGSILAMAFFIFYNTIFWSLFGQTVGQAILGIRVLSMKGQLPGFFRAFLRAAIGISLSIGFFIISFLMILLDFRHLALHDRIFRTVVVYTWDAHPSKRFMDRFLEKYGDQL